MPGLLIRILGGIAVGLVYNYYYGGGDTLNFFRGARHIAVISTTDLDAGWHYLTLNPEEQTLERINNDQVLLNYGVLDYYRDPQNYMMVVFLTPFALLGLFSYLGTSVYVSAMCFLGAWAMYRAVASFYPDLRKQLAYIILFLPTLVFWGGGIFKDSLALSVVGILFYAAVKLLRSNFRNYTMLVISVPLIYFVGVVKEYVLYSFVPLLVFYLVLSVKEKVQNRSLRLAITPFLFVVSLVGGYFVLSKLSGQSDKYSLDVVADRAQITHDDLVRDYYYVKAEGSVYDIGAFDAENPLSLITKIPLALSVTFIRPFFWEINNNPFMILSALESLFITCVIIYIFTRVGVVRTIYLISSRPLLIFFFVFSLTFGFMVGLTSGNYGNLARYKIPCVPFFLCGLYILLEEVKIARKKLDDERMARKIARLRVIET
ncbi:MAG: hypothetical protein KF690_02035 [Bacteroidetes bacterium]|nr:hypothetical protein [Bacteroidota bacterium]